MKEVVQFHSLDIVWWINCHFPLRLNTIFTKFKRVGYCTTIYPPLFSPFSTISLCRVGQYFSHAVFSVLCHVFSQLVFLHVSLYVVPPSLSRSASVPPPRNLVAAILHRCGWVLASSSGQTTLVFCFPGKFKQVLRGPASWCLHFWCGPTWSFLLPISTSLFRLNLVCSHLSSLRPNILNRTTYLPIYNNFRPNSTI